MFRCLIHFPRWALSCSQQMRIYDRSTVQRTSYSSLCHWWRRMLSPVNYASSVFLYSQKTKKKDSTHYPSRHLCFTSSIVYPKGHPGRVASDGGANSIFRFWLKRKGHGTKRCWKMKRRQWVHLNCIGKEARHGATAWRRRSEKRWHREGKREEMPPIGLTWILLDQKLKKIYAVDSAATKWTGKI
jgi:hypothetical protein